MKLNTVFMFLGFDNRWLFKIPFTVTIVSEAIIRQKHCAVVIPWVFILFTKNQIKAVNDNAKP